MSFFDIFRTDEKLVRQTLDEVQEAYPTAWLRLNIVDDVIVVSGEADSVQQRQVVLSTFRNLDPGLTAVLGGGLRVRETGSLNLAGGAPSPVPFSPEQRSSMAKRTTQRIYRIQMGDTLTSIAEKFYEDPLARLFVCAVNGERLVHPDRLIPGWVLSIPEALEYTVREGDTLASIARKFFQDETKQKLLMLSNPEIQLESARFQQGIQIRIPIQNDL